MSSVAGSSPDCRSASTTFGKRAGSTARMSSRTDGAPVRSMTSQIARETSSRGASSSTKRSPSGPTIVAPSPRIASVTRKPSRPGCPSPPWGGTGRTRGRRSPRPRAARAASPVPWEPGGLVVRAPERGGAAGRDAGAARPHGEIVLAEHADDAAVVEPEVGGPWSARGPGRSAARRGRPTAGARRGARSRCRPRARCAAASGRPPGRATGSP